MAPSNSESRRNKESRTAQIGNLKTQENHHQHTAFLQNLILAQIKSRLSIKGFRILHGRLDEFLKQSPATAANVKTDADKETLFKQFQAWEAERGARAQAPHPPAQR
jgi:hypothetical protein